MYVAPQPDKGWLRNVQRALYTRSRQEPDYVFRKLWGLMTDLRNLRMAFARVARNKGKRTPGVDGITVRKVVVAGGVDAFVERLRVELRASSYQPSPVRRVLIPKAGQPGKFRPLGIPTVRDRVVQAALKNVLEPLFEADFYPTSYGFRPKRSVHGALECLRRHLRPVSIGQEQRLPYQWAIEGDIKGCFDNIDHHGLMVRVRRRVGDPKVNRLVVAFLKAGVLSEEQFLRSPAGTPQGGILSPLLANIALGVLEERYERHVWPRKRPVLLTEPTAIEKRAVGTRSYDRKRGLIVSIPIRYADDFVILIGAPPGPDQQKRAREAAEQEKAALAAVLKEQLNLELSETKTLVTPVTSMLRFLGHQVMVRPHPTYGRWVSSILLPKDRAKRQRQLIKNLFRRNMLEKSLAERLRVLNPMVRGWCYFYRHAWGAKRKFAQMDSYVWWTILRWLRKKHRGVSMRQLAARYGWRRPRQRGLRWRDGGIEPFEAGSVRVSRYRWGEKTSVFA
jgi:group II intron reverse transcriptase/maturase